MNKTIELTINVNEHDIKHGLIGVCHHCPIARAVRRAVGNITPGAVAVAPNGMSFKDDKGYWTAKTPERAKQFINDFDDRKEVKPIRFTVTFEQRPKAK